MRPPGEVVLGGRPAGDNLGNPKPASLPTLVGQRRRKRNRIAGQPQVSTAHATVSHQRGHDLAGCRVDRDGQSQARSGDGGIDPDHLSGRYDQRPARVTRVQSGVSKALAGTTLAELVEFSTPSAERRPTALGNAA